MESKIFYIISFLYFILYGHIVLYYCTLLVNNMGIGLYIKLRNIQLRNRTPKPILDRQRPTNDREELGYDWTKFMKHKII